MSLEKPRWKDGPVICEVANLPAFLNQKAMVKFFDSLCTYALVSWQCSACMRWHGWAKPPSPAGSSSGTQRHYAIPARIRKLIQETRYEPNQ